MTDWPRIVENTNTLDRRSASCPRLVKTESRRLHLRSLVHLIHAACTLGQIEDTVVVLLELMTRDEIIEECTCVRGGIRADSGGQTIIGGTIAVGSATVSCPADHWDIDLQSDHTSKGKVAGLIVGQDGG